MRNSLSEQREWITEMYEMDKNEAELKPTVMDKTKELALEFIPDCPEHEYEGNEDLKRNIIEAREELAGMLKSYAQQISIEFGDWLTGKICTEKRMDEYFNEFSTTKTNSNEMSEM